MDMTDLDIEIGFICDSKPLGNETVLSSEIPKGRYVTAVHIGPYSAMAPLYEAMSTFIAEKRLNPTGEAIEFYYNSPMEVQESELKTKILLGVKDLSEKSL
jgi:effector-binding domain-containing protein